MSVGTPTMLAILPLLVALLYAAAAPDAPPEYVVLEKIARHRGVGVWGIPIGNWPGH
ncbi:MAG TPA: hypothetical protein PK018_18580 [Candidatus Competibacter sp.]|nr:hypothetical protein [Candidatus Competibacteraceae bacterium]HPE74151.1 hypothetical protein [Candidatus Competibacter sp.]